MIWLIAPALGSLLPIWRQGPHNAKTGGLNFWEYLEYVNQDGTYAPYGHPHIPYAEAVARAQEAYNQARTIGRRADE